MSMSTLVARCGNKVVYERTVESKWTGEIEEYRQQTIQKSGKIILACVYGYKFATSVGPAVALAADTSSADQIRKGFMQIIEVFTAITEPILWFYAITACILMATGKNKDVGWAKLKNVGYAYVFITLLPTFFVFLRWVAKLVGGAIATGSL